MKFDSRSFEDLDSVTPFYRKKRYLVVFLGFLGYVSTRTRNLAANFINKSSFFSGKSLHDARLPLCSHRRHDQEPEHHPP
jgi:hypothetical protein